jgi:hypothetical protein
MTVVIPGVSRLWLTPEGDVVVEYSSTGVDRKRERDRIVRELLAIGVRSEVPPEGVPWWEVETIKLLGEGRRIIAELRRTPWVTVIRHTQEETEEQYRRRLQSRERYERGTFPTPLVGRMRPGLVEIDFLWQDLKIESTPAVLEIKVPMPEHEPI